MIVKEWHKCKKSDFVTVTNICDTDNRSLFPHRLTVSVEITIIFVAFTIVLSQIQFFKVSVTKYKYSPENCNFEKVIFFCVQNLSFQY